jgi:hypothetical protein
VTDWLELGTYLPLYSLTGSGHFHIDGAKLRAAVCCAARSRTQLFYGINFELSELGIGS